MNPWLESFFGLSVYSLNAQLVPGAVSKTSAFMKHWGIIWYLSLRIVLAYCSYYVLFHWCAVRLFTCSLVSIRSLCACVQWHFEELWFKSSFHQYRQLSSIQLFSASFSTSASKTLQMCLSCYMFLDFSVDMMCDAVFNSRVMNICIQACAESRLADIMSRTIKPRIYHTIFIGHGHGYVWIPVSVNKTFIVCELLPCNAAAETALHPLIWCHESLSCHMPSSKETVLSTQSCILRRAPMIYKPAPAAYASSTAFPRFEPNLIQTVNNI